MYFERGKDPKEALGIGVEGMLKEINGVIFHRKDFTHRATGIFADQLKSETYDIYRNTGVVIAVYDGKFKILKNRYGDDLRGQEGDEVDLPDVIKAIYDSSKRISTWTDFRLSKTKQTIYGKPIRKG